MRRAFLVLMLAHCLSCGPRICTDVGCGDVASIAIHRADWATQPFAVELELDGVRVTCPAPVARMAWGRPCDNAQVRVEHRELADCTEVRTKEAVSQSCKPNGRLEQVIMISGTPQRIVATVLAGDGVPQQQRSFEFSYMLHRPNGEGCEPVCRQHFETWELP